MTDREIWQQRALAERGMILAVLYNAALPTVDRATIRGCLDQVGMPTQTDVLARHLLHLEQRGYIRAHHGHALGISVYHYELTADGRDLVVGAREDAGVRVPDLGDC